MQRRGNTPLLGALVVLGFTLLLAIASEVGAQAQTPDQQKCTNSMNKNLRRLTQRQSTNVIHCIQEFAKGRTQNLGPGGTASSCLTADPKGRLQRALDKTRLDWAKTCDGDAQDGQSKLPPYGVTNPNSLAEIVMKKELKLIAEIFGSDLDAALVTEAADAAAARCQRAAAKALRQCEDTRLREFNSCTRHGLRPTGASAAIISAEDMASCLTQDRRGRIAQLCDDPAGRDRFRGVIEKHCVNPGVDLSEAFPGCNTDDPEDLHTCLSGRARCQTCVGVLAADGLPGWPCDGCAIGSAVCESDERAFCVGGPRDGLPCEDPLVNSDCGPLGNRGNCVPLSGTFLNGRGGFIFDVPQLTRQEISCGVPDPLTGIAECECRLLTAKPIDLGPAIGTACIVQAVVPGCGGGSIDCRGSGSIDVDYRLFHNLGTCGLSDDPNQTEPGPALQGPAECEAACQQRCVSLGPGWRVLRSGCEGYCRSGVRDRGRCDIDRVCLPGGECVGADPVAHQGTCQCDCIQEDHGVPSDPGGLRCQFGLFTQVESEPPCDGIDVTLQTLSCVPQSTMNMTTTIFDADNIEGAVIGPIAERGRSRTCADFSLGRLSGLRRVGNAPSYDGGLGDLNQPSNNECK